MDLKEKVADEVHMAYALGGSSKLRVDRILALFEEERREMADFIRIIQTGLQPGGSPPPTLSLLAHWIVRSVQDEREAAEAREAKLVEALVKVRRIVETDSQIHSQIKVSNIVSAALGKEVSK